MTVDEPEAPANAGCQLCGIIDDPDGSSRIYQQEHWTAATLPRLTGPGAIAVVARRHVVGLEDLDDAEGESLGPMLRLAAQSLKEVCGAAKIYTFSFGEKHAHFHVAMVPRPPDLAPEDQGVVLVAAHLGSGSPPGLDLERSEIVTALRRAMASGAGS